MDASIINGFFYSGLGDNLATSFNVIIMKVKFFHGSVIKSILIVAYKLFPVIGLQGNK
ncbi:hypothetical protein [Selenomonas ruminantium]|uniref:hypothetical protein n=1 Tax=Selenomonas ruminantium TaxID=971 RepID=UPI001B7FB04C|nr:hypothetical protein [Selenomonas ruminantium]